MPMLIDPTLREDNISLHQCIQRHPLMLNTKKKQHPLTIVISNIHYCTSRIWGELHESNDAIVFYQ